MPNNELYKITATLQQKNNPQASVAPQKTTEQLAAERLFAKTASSATDISQKSTTASGLAVVRPIEYTVPKEAIYDRLNDGSYIAKFENYIGAEGNEDRLAKEQTTGEKWGHGATKMVAKIGTYAFDSVVGTAYGIGAAIGTGQFSKLYDNDFASSMDDINKKLDNNFANYYSDEEKSMGVLQSMGTANFWANDVTGGLAFVGGAILPSVALGALTGGATLGAGAGKLSLKLGSKIAKEAAEEGLEATGKSAIKKYARAKLASTLATPIEKAAFFARTASFEAGMEARQSYKTNVQDFYTKFEEQHGRLPTAEEAKPFLDDARNASNAVYGTNLAILSVSNAVMFGKKILPTVSSNFLAGIDNTFIKGLKSGLDKTIKFGDNIVNQANKAIGLGVKTEMVDGVLTKSMIKATKGQKILGNVFKIAKKPLTEGLYEEGFQGVTTKTAENFLDAKYDSQNTETLSLMANLADGFKEQYGSNEGWKEMAVGMIIGFGGGGMSPGAFKKGSGAFSGLGSDSRLSTQKQKEASLKRANEGVVSFRNLNRTEGARAFAVLGSEGKVARNYEDIVAGHNFIKSQEHISTPGQILEDHHSTIDAMEFQEPEMKEFLADRGVSEQEYKESLKSSFETTLKQYRKASKWADSLGLDRTIKDTPGNLNEVKEAFVLNAMLGMSSLEESKKHLDQLDKLIGTSGIFDAHEFYQSLSDEQKDQIDLLDKKNAELEELKKQAIVLGEQAAGSRVSTGATSEQLNKKRVETSEKAFQTQQAVIRVTQEIADLTKGLERAYGPHQANQRINDPTSIPQNINTTLDKLREANSYVASLAKAGETATTTAGTVQYLMNQAKYHSDAHREMVNMQNRMVSTNFFSSKEGKGLLDRIRGKKYVMSEDLRKSIEDNDKFVDESLRLMGQRGSESESVIAIVQKALEDNENLSEREKHRIEDLVRLQLTGSVAAAIVKDLTTSSEQIAATQVKSTKGDTVALAKKLGLKEKDLSTVDAITAVIDEITNELDSIIGTNGKNAAEIANLKEQLQTLKDKRDAIKESIKQEEILNQQSSSSEREGTSSGQQEEGESEGSQRETTSNATNNSNSTIPSETQEEIDIRRVDTYIKQNNAMVLGEVLDNQGDPVYEEDKGIGANGLSTLTDKKYGHGHNRSTGLDSLTILENLLGGATFSGMFGQIGKGQYSTWENGTFIIVSNNINPITDEKLNLNEVEIILNAGLSPFAQELANKYPNVVFKDFNGKKYDAENATAPSQTQTEEEKIAYLENSKLDNNAANRKLAEIAKSENIDLSKLTREEYVDYAIKNGLRISDTELRNAPELRTPTTMDETMALRKSLRESLTEKTKEVWNKWTNAIEVLASKSQQERYILNGVRVLSGTANSNSWLFFDINNSQVDSTQAPYKSYFSLKDFNNITPEQVVKFMEFLQQKGYKGGIKTFQDLENQGVLLNDQFVLHGDTEADAKLGEELAKEFFKEEIKSTGLGKDGFENGKSKSYSQILSDKISNSIDDIINGKTTIEQQTTPTQTSQQEVVPTVEELEESKDEIDKLISQRIANYGLEPFDLFEGMSEADINIIERAKRGEVVDMNALQGSLDFIYKVYKDLLDLKKPENSKDRLVKSITLEYLDQVQEILEEDLEFLQTYKNANETGETLPTFEYATESTVVTPTEGGATETIAGFNTTIPIQETELDKINAEIEAIENRLKKLEGERYQIIESQEYKRFTQLSAKKEKDDLTPNEEAELVELKDALDTWTMITGIVIDGFRLSDLIEQKVVLESTPIVEPENLTVQESTDTMEDVDIPDKTRAANSTFGNTYEKVIFSTQGTGDKKIYTIHHLTQAGFEDIVGNLPIKTDRLDEYNNIMLTAEEVAIINENTNIKIITDSKYSRASTVIVTKLMPDGTTKYEGLDSDFNSELREGHDFQAIYESEAGNEVEVFIDPKSDYNNFHLARIRNLFKELEKTKKNPTKTRAIKEKIKAEKIWLQENLQIMARVNGKVVATFKGLRSGVKNDTDLLFAEFRKAIVNDDNNLAAITSDTANGVISVKVKGKDGITRKPEITVKQVLLGIPNYNYDQNEEGEMVTVFKPVPEQSQDKVVDMGYSLDGKTFTRNGTTVNTTFLANLTKRSKGKKIPFVVLEVGDKRVAYPVRVETSREVNTEDFESLYNSELSDSDKAKALNRFMAANGIDIKIPGNAFISFGTTNLTDENFQNKLAQLKEINYFYRVEDWIEATTDMKDVLTNQVSIDIDVNNPFHSPKLMFDYSKLDLAKGKVTKQSTATATSEDIDDEAEESSIFC